MTPGAAGAQPSEPWEFDLSGGELCLDFINSLSFTSGEHLHTYADLIRFAFQSGLLTQSEADWLRAEGERDHLAAQGIMRRARDLRSALRGIFDAIALGRRVPPSDLAYLNLDLAVSMQHARVEPSGSGFKWDWSGLWLDSPLWPISRSAAELLISDEKRPNVRQCGSDECRWLFLDTTRNRSRQWCSMQSCGNREKARRHYQRVRATRAPAADSSRRERRGTPAKHGREAGPN